MSGTLRLERAVGAVGIPIPLASYILRYHLQSLPRLRSGFVLIAPHMYTYGAAQTAEERCLHACYLSSSRPARRHMSCI